MALALDNSATGIKEAFSSLNKALTGDASDEARAAYYGSEVALNRQKAEDLRNTALGRSALADALSGGVTGPALYGKMAFDPNYLQLGPNTNLGLTTTLPGMTPQSPQVQMAQIGAREPYSATYGGTQDDLGNRLAQTRISAGATVQAANIHAGEQRYEFENTNERVQIPDPRPGAPPNATIEVPLARRVVRGAPPGTYLAPLSGPQAEVQVAQDKPMPVRIPDPKNPARMIDTFAPAGTISRAPEGQYTPPLTEPQVSQQRADQDYRKYLDTTERMLDVADGQEKLVSNRDRLANPNRFIAPKSSAQVQQEKDRLEVTTTAQKPYVVDKNTSEAINQEVLNQLDAALGLKRDSKGMGGLTLGVDPANYPGLDIGKIKAVASELYQLRGDITGAVRAAVLDSVGDKPQRPSGGWWTGGGTEYKPGGTVPAPTVERDASGQVVRPPAVTTRRREDTTEQKPYVPPVIAPIEPPAAPAAPPAQQDIPPEQKVTISRSLENASPQDAKASAKRMIQQKPQLRAAIIKLLQEHNIDTGGL